MGTNAICKIVKQLEDNEAELQLMLAETAEAILALKPEHFKDDEELAFDRALNGG